MIRYSLKCANGHGFDSWFQSASAFEGLKSSGHVACPDCGVASVEKALMAPQVRPARKAAADRAQGEQSQADEPAEAAAPGPLSVPQSEREAALAALRRLVETKSEHVGMRFAAEARRIHAGEAPGRMIHGEAKPEEARALIEEGVPVAPLPFVPQRNTN